MINWEERAKLVVEQVEQIAAALDAADEAASKLGWDDVSAEIAAAKRAVMSRLGGDE